jgi:hypothetical protein
MSGSGDHEQRCRTMALIRAIRADALSKTSYSSGLNKRTGLTAASCVWRRSLS